MYFILPDEGVSIDTVLSDPEALSFMTQGWSYENKKHVKVNLSLPKFDVDSSMDLIDGLKNLGVESCFDFETSDFSPILGDSIDAEVSKVSHAARVKIDEEGVVATSYIEMPNAGSAAPPDDEVDFILDRPFIFVIANSDGLPLFVGVVNQP